MVNKARLASKVLGGVLTGSLSYIVYYFIPLLVIKQFLVLPVVSMQVGQVVFRELLSVELFNLWVLIGLISLSVVTSILSENIIGVVIGAAIPIVLVVYVMSLMNFGVVTVGFQGYTVDVDILPIPILVIISTVIWSIARVFKYVENL